MRTIKTSELYRAILLYDLDSINEHPEIYSAHEVVESMKVVDMVVGQIAVDIYDDGNDEIPDYFEISRMDFDISYIIDVFDSVYTRGCLAYIDCLIDYLTEKAQCAEITQPLS